MQNIFRSDGCLSKENAGTLRSSRPQCGFDRDLFMNTTTHIDAAPMPVAAPMDLLIPSVSPFLAASSTAATGPWPPPSRPRSPEATFADVI